MSGGSYNYLAHTYDLEDILAKRRDLEAMSERLEGMSELEFPGATAAGRMTRDLLLKLQLWDAHASASIALLKDVWHDVEWWDSNDYGPDQVRDGLNKLLSGETKNE